MLLWYNLSMKVLKFLFNLILSLFTIVLLGWFLLDMFKLNTIKKQIIDTIFPNTQLNVLRQKYLNDKIWNIEKDPYINELNFARYSAKHHKLSVYMSGDLPTKNIQLKTFKEIDQKGIIYDGNFHKVGLSKNLFPLHYNKEIFKLANAYASSGAVDTNELVHSPNNPNFSGPKASATNPVFKRWNISDYVQVKKESISTGYENVHDTIVGWINEDDNIEQNKASVIGHRLHILDTNKDENYAAIAKSAKQGWVMHSGVVLNKNWELVNSCDFINLDQANFTYVETSNLFQTTYFPTQKNILKFNPNICRGIEIKAYYPNNLNNPLQPQTLLNQQQKTLIFTQQAKKGFVLKNADTVQPIQIRIQN